MHLVSYLHNVVFSFAAACTHVLVEALEPATLLLEKAMGLTVFD
jgi:hypothetical protein